MFYQCALAPTPRRPLSRGQDPTRAIQKPTLSRLSIPRSTPGIYVSVEHHNIPVLSKNASVMQNMTVVIMKSEQSRRTVNKSDHENASPCSNLSSVLTFHALS